MGLHRDRAVYIAPDFEISDALSLVDRFMLTIMKKLLTDLQFWCQRCGRRIY